jgi:hypothetical protein
VPEKRFREFGRQMLELAKENEANGMLIQLGNPTNSLFLLARQP